MDALPDAREQFVALSAALTGYDRAELHGTGMIDSYWLTLNQTLGGRVVGELLSAWMEVSGSGLEVSGGAGGQNADAVEADLRQRILEDPKLGPVARNLVILWYLGQWSQMSAQWRERHGASAEDRSRVVSPGAYREGLVWDAIGAHPMSAKQQGFGAWALPPRGTQGPRGQDPGDD